MLNLHSDFSTEATGRGDSLSGPSFFSLKTAVAIRDVIVYIRIVSLSYIVIVYTRYIYENKIKYTNTYYFNLHSRISNSFNVFIYETPKKTN